jgi:ribose 5-phosphate isomerase A
MSDASDRARTAAARAVLDEVQPDSTIALGSGRAVWRVIDEMAALWPEAIPVRAVVASSLTEERARTAGIEIAELDGVTVPVVAIDGADEVGPGLALIKGGGGALLREKIVIAAAERFVVVAETNKRVERLGQEFRLPVEVVRFGWRDTARRLERLLPGAELRVTDDGKPFVTDEKHVILDGPIPADVDPDELAARLSRVPGVVEHGLFIGMAERAYLGTPDGGVEVLQT